MPIPGVFIETLLPPQEYSDRQISLVCAIADALHRGKLVLCIPPERR